MGCRLGQPIRIVSYDPQWPRAFEEERALLWEAIGEWVSNGIHHVGGTAVPGVDGESVVDILVGVEALPLPKECLTALGNLGYSLAFEDWEEVYRRPAGWDRLYDLYALPATAPRFDQILAFRDLLRANLQTAIGYAGMKRDLARRHGSDRHAYTVAKGELVEAALSRLAPRAVTAVAELS